MLPTGSSLPLRFEQHLEALLRGCRDIQEHGHELQAEFLRHRPHVERTAVEAAHQHAATPPSMQLIHKSDRDVAPLEEAEPVKLMEPKQPFTQDTMSETTPETEADAPDADFIRSQFDRLKDPDTGMVRSEVLRQLVRTHCPGHVLENLAETLTFAIPNPAWMESRAGSEQLAPDHDGPTDEGSRPTRRTSMSHLTKMVLTQSSGAPPKQERFDIKLEGFHRLRSKNVLEQACYGIKRDLRTLQKAFVMEEQHVLYEDDGHDDYDNKLKANPYRAITDTKEKFLEFLPPIVVFMHVVVVGASEDVEPNSHVWIALEIAFTTFYFLEAVVKIGYYGVRGYFCGPDIGWNWLDFVILIMSLSDLFITTVLVHIAPKVSADLTTFVLFRLIRLCRLARLMKTLRLPFFKELRLMMQGLASGARVMVWAVVMLVIMIYIMAIALNKLLVSEEQFSTVVGSMSTLFGCFTEGCISYVGELRARYGMHFLGLYWLGYVCVTLGVFNLIMALFIDNVTNTQAERKQRDLSDTSEHVEVSLKEALIRLIIQSKASGVPEDIEEEIKSLDTIIGSRPARVRAQFGCLAETDIEIQAEQFTVWLDDKQFVEVLDSAEIDVHNNRALFEVLDADLGGSLTVSEVFNGLMKLRGPVTKADIIAIRLKVRHLVSLAEGRENA
eukprot:TRINITY_DN73523_c0_g1_i1.p1 TRINITY_DN73523_c0_g1~~TRINITY_DN73523_c0_g1_i1.p1  ORF type:complete len:745 (-),score=139.59 TRINITY_DN73523_c0_g1_i1:82-2088(-)